MINRKPPDLENKLLVLYATDQLGPMTSLQLLQFLAEYDLMDYITMQLTLGELLSTGHLSSLTHALGPMFQLTQEGRQSLSLFLSRLPHSTRSLVKHQAEVWRPRFLREMQMLYDFRPRDDGRYDIRLRLMEMDSPLLDMTFAQPTRDLADRLSRGWPVAAASFYGFLMNALGGSFSLGAVAPSNLPQNTSVELLGSGQGCVLNLRKEEAAFSLSVSLPTESMARFFALRWAESADAILTCLMDMLSEDV